MLRRVCAPILGAALIFTAGACDKAKEAAEDALGAKQLETEDIDALKKSTNWDASVDPEVWTIHGGFELTENFSGDLSGETEVPFPVSLGEADAAAAGKKRMLLIMKVENIKPADDTFTRFRIVQVAEHDAESNMLKISGATVNQYLDDSQITSKANENQTGQYVVAEAKGGGGLAYMTGFTQIKKYEDPKATHTGSALVFTTMSPFATLSGATSKQYFLAVKNGAVGQIIAFKKDVATADAAPGTPPSASEDIVYAGTLDDFKGDYDEKVGGLPADASAKATEGDWFNKANTAVTDFLDDWKLIKTDLTFIQPPPPAPPPVQPAEAKPTPPPAAAPTESTDKKVVQKEEATDPQVDLTCTGVNAADESTLRPSDETDNNKEGMWNYTGDVRMTKERHGEIFGAPADLATSSEGRYLDQVEGYCLLSTGNGRYNAGLPDTDSPQLKPIDDKRSELWQKVKVPSTAASIQMRVAFFTQEFPRYVGTQFNDGFYVKFDESPDFIVSGTLNDLAGINNPDKKAEVEGCKSQTLGTAQVKCGDWQSISKDAKITGGGVIWDIDKSKTSANSTSSDCGGGKCFHGYVPPRVICKNLDAEKEVGKTLTLRMSVTDAGDAYYDSAMAIDSIVFSQDACGDTGFSGDPRSEAKPAVES